MHIDALCMLLEPEIDSRLATAVCLDKRTVTELADLCVQFNSVKRQRCFYPGGDWLLAFVMFSY